MTSNAGTGTFTVGQGTAANLNATVVQSSGSNLHVDVDSIPRATVSGTVTSNQGAAAAEGTPPWPVAPQATDGGFPITELTDGTNLLATSSHPVRTDPTGTTTQPVSGTVTANAGTGTFAVSAVSLPLPSGAATSANQTNGTQETEIAQGGNVATVSAAGAQKVDGSAVTQPVSGTVTAAQATAASLNATVVQATGSDLHVQVDTAPTTTVTGTVTVAQATAANLNATVVQSTGANLHVDVDSAPSTAVTGTVTSNQGTANTLANGWPTELTDGTHGPAAVTAASTAVTAANPSLAVGLSPNSPLPAGSNALGSVSVTGTTTVAGTVTSNIGTTNGLALDTSVNGLSSRRARPAPVPRDRWCRGR